MDFSPLTRSLQNLHQEISLIDATLEAGLASLRQCQIIQQPDPIRSGLVVLKKSEEPCAQWDETMHCNFTEVEDDDQVVNACFEGIDQDCNGKLSNAELVTFFSALKPDQNSLVEPLKALESNTLAESGEDISLEAFKKVMDGVPRVKGHRMQWVRALNLPGRLARLLKVGEIFDQLSGIKKMTLTDLDDALKQFAAGRGRKCFES